MLPKRLFGCKRLSRTSLTASHSRWVSANFVSSEIIILTLENSKVTLYLKMTKAAEISRFYQWALHWRVERIRCISSFPQAYFRSCTLATVSSRYIREDQQSEHNQEDEQALVEYRNLVRDIVYVNGVSKYEVFWIKAHFWTEPRLLE